MEENIKQSELEREFELERVVLFSDAVFAIAITLMVLDIKYPVSENATVDFSTVFKPILIKFIPFVISFIFIGVNWARHIEMMRFVRQYNKPFIAFNLIFLFFIVLFPFSVSFLGQIKPSQEAPFISVYAANIILCSASFYVLSYYLFKVKPSLCFPDRENEKKYHLKRNLVLLIRLTVVGVSAVVLAIFPDSIPVLLAVLFGIIITVQITRRQLKHLRAVMLVH